MQYEKSAFTNVRFVVTSLALSVNLLSGKSILTMHLLNFSSNLVSC